MNNYGRLDASYKAAGEEKGIRKLVDDFYHEMETQAKAQHIRSMHKDSLDVIKDKLALFLMGWLGGPRKYGEKYGGISIPMVHKHLVINEEERDAWLFCMQQALKYQDYDEDFKEYLLVQLSRPANRIMQVSQASQG